jgi:hypothetical protein
MMSIFGLRILPPFAIARLGSAGEPLDNYTIEENPEHPLDFRMIKGAQTLIVDEGTGEIAEARTPQTVTFKNGGKMRPVAPFLEVFAQTDPDPSKPLEPLTLALLAEHGLGEGDVKWCVTVANRKVVRRTNDPNDLVAADTGWFSSHESHRLEGYCKNFIAADRFIDFGRVRYITPNKKFPQIRLRFTPAQGLIYGPNVGVESAHGAPLRYQVPTECQIYDKSKGWFLFNADSTAPDANAGAATSSPVSSPKTGTDPQTTAFYNDTLPPSLFAIFPPAPSWLNNDVAISRGYLDDACDGFVDVRLTLRDGTQLSAGARICAAPPVVVPDSLFVRTLLDDLEQVIEGPEISADEPYEVIRAKAEDIVRRAYETVRLMNVAVMNGNAPEGRPPLSIDTKPADEAGNTDRLERPVLTPATVDTLAIMALHEQVFAALRSGAMPWFLRILRQPEEVADFTDEGRRKMPALMCGADDNYLALTRRQIDIIRAASDMMAFTPDLTWHTTRNGEARNAQELTPRNRTAHVSYAAAGNPISSRPVNAIANCCPGLEVDFRAVWRRIFEGIELREYDNLVLNVDANLDDPRKAKLKGHRLLRVNGTKVMAQMIGPSPDSRFDTVVLATQDNPDGVAPLEWSNALARILHENAGQPVTCDFTAEESPDDQVWWDDGDDDHPPPPPPPHLTLTFRIRPFFEGETAVISRTLAEVGELTQGLCSPWQNDYRECSCYYWAAARPDYVNVEPAANGMSQGDNWLQKEHTGHYVPDDYVDSRLIMYDDLFLKWEELLRMVVRGRDMPEAPEG